MFIWWTNTRICPYQLLYKYFDPLLCAHWAFFKFAEEMRKHPNPYNFYEEYA